MNKISTLIIGLLGTACLCAPGAAQATPPYPAMAPVDEYLMPDKTVEIALARSAAPPSVSADAEILVLGPKGYGVAVAGKNGFTCLVERSWFAGLKDEGFWNPAIRGPDCYNRQAARSVLPTFLTRTRWVLAGASRDELIARTRAAMAAGRVHAPEAGSMNYMLSKHGYLGDATRGPWHPHLMFFVPPMQASDWGADLAGTHIFAARADAGIDPYTLFFVPVGIWSDGTPDDQAGGHHDM
jgi:hypothetical protein